MKKNRFDVKNPNLVRYYDDLSNYEWVYKFVKLRVKEREAIPLEAEKKKILGAICSKPDFMLRLRESYQKLEDRRRDLLSALLFGTWRSADKNPLAYYWLQSVDVTPHMINIVPQWSELEEIMDSLEIKGTISEADREKSLKKLDCQLEKLQVEVERLCPDKYCKIDSSGNIVVDKRKVFVREWREVQLQVAGPCGPLGLELTLSPKREVEAWGKLNFDKLVSSFSRFLPHPGEGVPPRVFLK